MFRKSALAMAMLGVLATENVAALGLGEIELKSALNQPLMAEVELLSATAAELKELKVEIASSQAFENAGIERPLFLTRLKFAVNKNAGGKPVVQITSRDVVREPFLDFLLELSWSKGKLLREYTVLVDPPVTMSAPAPVLQPPTVRSAQPLRQPVPAQPATRVQHTAQLPPVSVEPGQYLTRRNDTLWKVAEAVRPDTDVSMEQAMLGLLRTNPEAFYDNNINNLKAGYILRVPGREDMTSISKAEALRQTRAQYQAWQQARAAATGAPQPAEGAEQAKGGPDATATASSEAQLQLVAPDMSEAGSAGGSAEEADKFDMLQRELMMANEALEAQRRQGEEMSGRVAVLEEQIRNMQRLVQLKDDQLAQMQAQVSGSGEAAEEVGAETGEAQPVPVEGSDVAQSAGEQGEPAGEAAGEPAGDTEAPMAEGTATPESPEGEDAGQMAAPEGESVTAAPVAEEPVTAEPVPEMIPEPELPKTSTPLGFVDQLMANPLWLGAGGVALALLAFFGLRRKRNVESGFEESILQASHGARGSDSASDSAAVGGGSGASSETSLLSEFAVSDMGSIKQSGEADPLAEADVYLAYGRFQQAEDLISEALEDNADDQSLNLKLLEVFLAAKNKTGFDAHAQSMLDRLCQVGDPLWEKVAEMGCELSPDNPMYQPGDVGGVQGAMDTTAGDADISIDGQNLDFESAAFESDISGEDVAETPKDDEQGLDFDIDLSYENAEPRDEAKPDSMEFVPEDESSEPEFDMGKMEADQVETDNALDFDLEGMDLGSDEDFAAEEAGDGELTDLDEVSTKLDLARAYIDMGDPDGAKSILDEVLEEGSDDQKTEAKGIMEQIS